MALAIKSSNRVKVNKEIALQEITKEKIVKLTFNIPKSTRLAFKMATTHNGSNMSDTILDFIETYIRK